MKLIKTLLATVVAVSAIPAMAYEAGDIIVKAGAVTVSPKDGNADSSGLVAGSELDVLSDTQLGLTGVYMVTSQIGVELLAATPFEHEVEGDGGAIDGATIATTKHLPPTVSVQYYPMGADSKLQPYVGLGVNHTFFFDEEDDADLGTKGLETSWGLTYSVGVDYALNDHWLVNAAAWKMDIDTKIKGGAADGLDVEIDPLVYFVGAGYKF
ncbi:OmpW family outer membrane protein [Oceanobacter sp. 5_MG-2023]|uniref:OmpW/AlkL family protein n=1 Tax=Oceanobacter sp. 5_MG-2023 TaxID=3062645 RepID=UPI0026E196F8|nr:OmpW family outer membrane protein [Oceanobacter sp. 5_MG-2023]MDO6683522.1 OmpW family outer membrane protein [Oceanobacter sp. 5_MG-2023]